MSHCATSPETPPSCSVGPAAPGGSVGFVGRLESLRGLAAMAVSAHHASLILPLAGWQLLLVEHAQILMNGRAAVTLFFVLSGLVLGLSLRRTHGAFDLSISQFYLRRIFRIVPAFFVCTSLIAAYLVFVYSDGPGPGGYWFEHFFGAYHQPVTARQVVMNLLFRDDSLNGIAWTLRIEIECSFLLPLFHWAASRLTLRQNIFLLLALPLVGLQLRGPGKYFYMFFAGYLLPLIGPALFAPLRQQPRRAALGVVAAGAAMLFARLIGENDVLLQGAGLAVECLGAAGLIGMLLYGPELKAYLGLDRALVRFYGRISYSYYLWHYFLLFLVTRFALELVSRELMLASPLMWSFLLWLISMLIATLAAYLSYRFVETPCIGLSKSICLKMNWRRTSAANATSGGFRPILAFDESPVRPRPSGRECPNPSAAVPLAESPGLETKPSLDT